VKEIYTEAGKSSSAESPRMINATPRNGLRFQCSAAVFNAAALDGGIFPDGGVRTAFAVAVIGLRFLTPAKSP
jgi:hypothetical protein